MVSATKFSVGELSVSVVDAEAVIASPERRSGTLDVEASAEALRRQARFDERGRYRPLSGARTLPGGWQTRCPADGVGALVDEVYPLALRHSEQWKSGTLRVVGMEDVLARQSGRYAVAASLDERGRGVATDALCARCVRTPVWTGAEPRLRTRFPAPSRAACLCRSAARRRCGSANRRRLAEPDPNVAFAAFDAPGNEIREAYLAARYGND